MAKSKNLFILLSLVIALIDGLFITTNYFYTKNSFNSTLQKESQNYYAIYQTVLESTYNSLSMQAALFAGDKRIQNLYLQGKKALEKEGAADRKKINTGGEETARIRNELYQLISEAWLDATKKFDVRQLHFHLGPGSLTFLRVHKPQKFGDRMDKLRFIIVDTNTDQTPRTGFETGRIYSGLRSVTPVFAWDETLNKKVYVGALEVGTSYKKLLQTIDNNLNIQLSVLLNNQHIKNTVWDEFLTGLYNNNSISNCDCILEASSRPGQKPLLEHIAKEFDLKHQLSNADAQVKIVVRNSNYYSIALHPLRDYLGQKDPSRYDIGAILIAKDITKITAAYQEEQLFNFLYGIIAYFIIELLLILTFLKLSRHLISQVNQQTSELTDQKRIIELDKVKYKNLIDSIDTDYFFYIRNKKNQFSYVSPSVTKVLGYSEAEFLSNTEHNLPGYNFQEYAHSDPAAEKDKKTFEIKINNANGRPQYLLITETAKEAPDSSQVTQFEGLAQDITQTRQDKMLLKLRCNIFQMISDNCEAKKILEVLVLETEAIIQDISCAILLINRKTNRFNIGAAPSLDNEFKNALDKQDISSDIGCWSIAAATAKRKIVDDLYKNPVCETLYQILKRTSYKSCWSEPVLSSDAQVIATVSVFYNEVRSPNESDLTIISTVADLVSIIDEKLIKN